MYLNEEQNPNLMGRGERSLRDNVGANDSWGDLKNSSIISQYRSFPERLGGRNVDKNHPLYGFENKTGWQGAWDNLQTKDSGLHSRTYKMTDDLGITDDVNSILGRKYSGKNLETSQRDFRYLFNSAMANRATMNEHGGLVGLQTNKPGYRSGDATNIRRPVEKDIISSFVNSDKGIF